MQLELKGALRQYKNVKAFSKAIFVLGWNHNM
jgi:hypothetical protein